VIDAWYFVLIRKARFLFCLFFIIIIVYNLIENISIRLRNILFEYSDSSSC
jgi:hypothetical protein